MKNFRKSALPPTNLQDKRSTAALTVTAITIKRPRAATCCQRLTPSLLRGLVIIKLRTKVIPRKVNASVKDSSSILFLSRTNLFGREIRFTKLVMYLGIWAKISLIRSFITVPFQAAATNGMILTQGQFVMVVII